MNRLLKKKAIITGASSGIGHSCARILAEHSVDLVLISRREERLEELKQDLSKKFNITITALSCDVRNQKQVAKTVQSIVSTGDIDILINSAGLALGLGKIDEGITEDWDTMIDTNIKGVLYMVREIIPHMRKNNKGHIVTIGSIAGEIAYPNGNVYCATKAAIKMLNDAINIDLVGTNIKVSNILPGAANTEFSTVRFKGNQDTADKVYRGYKPLSGDDVAELIVYVLNTPDHVNIQSTTIVPTNQRNAYVLHRDL